jgi:hypothetical protein
MLAPDSDYYVKPVLKTGHTVILSEKMMYRGEDSTTLRISIDVCFSAVL